MAKPAIQTFGKYQILERIATGGMAEIYKARLEGIGGFQRTFAIKRILPNLSQNSDYIAMLVDEAKVAGLLSHANIVQILDLGQVDGVWYIAMEYVAGPDLGRVLRRAREKGLCLPVPHGVFAAIELLKGLEYAHQRQVMRGGKPVPLNIIHRDVSPPNILLSYSGEVKLTDFGIARATLRAMETVSGIVKGRFDYMSPEQAAGSKDLDQRSDLFAVGVVLYEMLTGVHPFRADNELATVERVRMGKYTPVSERNPEVPFTLETIVDRALRVNKTERYPTATAFKEALDKFFHDSGFIFTHATLSTYLRGLFPESAPKTGGAPSLPARPVRKNKSTPGGRSLDDLEAGDLLDDTEFPTRLLDQKQMQREMEALRSHSGFGLKNPDMERTAVKENPLLAAGMLNPTLAADEQETVIRRGLEDSLPGLSGVKTSGPTAWDEDQETVIKPSPFLDDQNDTWVARAEDLDFEDDSIPTTHSHTAEVVAREVERSITGRALGERSETGRGPNYALVAGLLAVTLMLGSVLGAVLAGGVSVLVIGGNPGPAEPRLRVEAPERTAVKVDGDAVSNEVTLQPGTAHALEILVPGQEPWTTTLTAEAGEVHVIIVTGPPTPLEEPAPKPD